MTRGRTLLPLALAFACNSPADDPSFRRGDEVDDPAAGFVPRVDMGFGFEQCSTWSQNCPAGQACQPYVAQIGFDATLCSEVDPGGGLPAGSACEIVGETFTGPNPCERGSMCWGDECTAFCTGSRAQSSCVDPDARCVTLSEDLFGLCFSTCDPIAPDCDVGEACTSADFSEFLCLPDASGDLGAQGDPCEFINACDPGLQCMDATQLSECPIELGCCTAVCDLRAPVCPDGLGCAAFYIDPPVGLEHVGVCLDPV